MKKLFFLFLTVLCTISLFSQVGILTEDPKATLDIIYSENNPGANGILIPRMTGDQIEAMSVNQDQNGLLVYATKPSTLPKAVVIEVGFWYYDAPSSIWKPLLSLHRRSSVSVKSDGTADYLNLQDAYDGEAKKLYSPEDNYLQFICEGDVGHLIATGAIPRIEIVGERDFILGKLDVYNTTLSFSGNITTIENIDIINSSVTFSTDLTKFNITQLFLERSSLNISLSMNVSNIILDQSTVDVSQPNVTIDFNPVSPTYAGISLNYSSFKGLVSTKLQFLGSQQFTNYIKCDDLSSFNSEGSINASAPVENAIVFSTQGSRAAVGAITGTAIPKAVLHASSNAKIEHIRGEINMKTSGDGFLSVAGSTISLGGEFSTDDSVLTNINPKPTSAGFNASGGEISISNQKSHKYTLNNYNYALSAIEGGKIITLEMADKGTSAHYYNIYPGMLTPSGSMIYIGKEQGD